MRIGFFGNTNNYPFILARAMRALGHEVVFFVEAREPLHRPEYRYRDVNVPYPDWIIDVSLFRLPHYSTPNARRRKVLRTLERCDAVILNGLGASLLADLDVPGVILLTGSDLEYFADYRSLRRPFQLVAPRSSRLARAIRSQLVRLFAIPIVPAQRAAIRKARGVNFFPRGVLPQSDALLDEIGLRPERRMMFLMIDAADRPYEPPPERTILRSFCATRLNWKRPIPDGFTELDYKGSDVMVRGLARFSRESGRRMEIRLVKKGLHIRETIELVEELGLSDQVVWLDEMDQQRVSQEFREADIAFEHFANSTVGMAGLDAMAEGRPLIANWRPEIMNAALGEPAPVCHATTPEEIADHLVTLHDRERRLEIGLACREFARRMFSPHRAAQMCLNRLGVTSGT